MATLTLLAPPGAGLKYPVPESGTITLGRDRECDVVFRRRSLSRQHARILASAGEFILEDSGSTNGTYLNGQRIHEPTPIRDGDVINLHDFPIAFSLEASESDVGIADTKKLRSGESVPTGVTEHALPVYAGSPGASILRGRLSSLIEIAQHIGGNLDPGQLPPRILDLLFKMFPQSSRGEVFLSERHNMLSPVATREGSESASAIIGRQPGVPDVVRQVWETGQGVIRNTDASDGPSVLYEGRSSVICVPVPGLTRGGLGVLWLQTSDVTHAFQREDLELALAVGVMAGQAFEFSRAHEILRESNKQNYYLETAHAIQIGMLPNRHPKLPGYAFAHYYSAARAVGGDYFFYEQLAADRVVVGIADASGKGMGAALTIARFAGEVRARILVSRTLKMAMDDLNRFVLDCGTETFITCCVCVLDAKTHTATIASAGHPSPLCRRRIGGQVEPWVNVRGGPPLGIDAEFECHPARFQFQPGDLLLLSTDGLSEAMNPRHELFGDDRTCQVLSGTQGDPDATIGTIVGTVDAFREGRPANDDMCLVAIQRNDVASKQRTT